MFCLGYWLYLQARELLERDKRTRSRRGYNDFKPLQEPVECDIVDYRVDGAYLEAPVLIYFIFSADSGCESSGLKKEMTQMHRIGNRGEGRYEQ